MTGSGAVAAAAMRFPVWIALFCCRQQEFPGKATSGPVAGKAHLRRMSEMLAALLRKCLPVWGWLAHAFLICAIESPIQGKSYEQLATKRHGTNIYLKTEFSPVSISATKNIVIISPSPNQHTVIGSNDIFDDVVRKVEPLTLRSSSGANDGALRLPIIAIVEVFWGAA